MKELLTQVFRFLADGTKIADPEQYDIKQFKRFKYQLEASQNYIFVDERSGQYKDIDEEKAKKLKLHFRKRVFDSA